MHRMRADILMITYNRPSYTRRSLDHLLDTCSDSTRVWLWHNGNDPETLSIVTERAHHPKVARFHHSTENVRLRQPTNWLWEHSTAELLGKVDDDCLVDPGWDEALSAAHAIEPTLGLIGAWRFYDEDFVPDLARRKTVTLPGGTQILSNPWLQGSGYLLKRRCVDQIGPLQPDQSFTAWCIRVALQGWNIGWHLPFIHEEHMDDPRSPYSEIREDSDLQEHLPLSAKRLGIDTVNEWTEQMRRSARRVQAASSDPRDYVGWRRQRRRVLKQLRRRFGGAGF